MTKESSPPPRDETERETGLEIGKRLRQIRLERGWTLNDVSQATAIAQSTLSKLENGQGVINLDTLMKLSNGLELSLDSLTSPYGRHQGTGVRSITRADGGEVYNLGPGQLRVLSGEIVRKALFPVVIRTCRLDDSPGGNWNSFPGERFIYVIRGRAKLITEFYAPTTLEPGDAAHFDSSMKHGMVSADGEEVEFISVSYDGTGRFKPIPELAEAEREG